MFYKVSYIGYVNNSVNHKNALSEVWHLSDHLNT